MFFEDSCVVVRTVLPVCKRRSKFFQWQPAFLLQRLAVRAIFIFRPIVARHDSQRQKPLRKSIGHDEKWTVFRVVHQAFGEPVVARAIPQAPTQLPEQGIARQRRTERALRSEDEAQGLHTQAACALGKASMVLNGSVQFLPSISRSTNFTLP